MEDIKYVRVQRHPPSEFVNSQWFGCTGELSKDSVAQYYLKSHKKNKTLLESVTEKYKSLEKAHSHAHSKVESNRNLALNIETHKKAIFYYTLEIEKERKQQDLMESSALKIQKAARGFLARRFLEEVIKK